MSGNGNQARAEANRGRASMHPAAYQRSDRVNSGRARCASSTSSNHVSSISSNARQQRGGGGGERGGSRR